MLYTADFETTTDPNDCRVWAWGVCSINEKLDFEYGNDIEGFMRFAKDHSGDTLYFHNLKFDGEFIISYLFQNGYEHTTSRKDIRKKTFSTLISDKGQFYSIEINFTADHKITIYDSLKLLPFGVEQVAKAFDLPIMKLELDYDTTREVGHELTEKEVAYLKNDVEIVARALKVLFDQNINKMTLGSSALAEYKSIVGKRNFSKWFPIPAYDYDIRQSYKGGFTYCDPRTQGQDIEEGLVFDVNSLYPSVMYYSPLPYGEGIYFDGAYQEDTLYNLYVVMITCQFELKEKHIPTIQLKNNLSFVPTQYLESSDGEEVTMCLTSVDLELFLEHYEVFDLEYHGGWKFKSTTGLFKKYIDKWNAIKMKATLEGNEGMRTLAKLMLNNIYGKFALNPRVQSKIPYMKDGVIKYRLDEPEERKPIYIPVGTFITAWARHKTITSAQKVYDRFLYADTDSLHLSGTEIPDCLEVDPVKLGAWKHESTFTRARFIRQKTYIEEIIVSDKTKNKMIEEGVNPNNFYVVKGENVFLSITCAGMPSRCYKNVNWDNFKEGARYEGKLQFTRVKNGVILKDTDFTIKG